LVSTLKKSCIEYWTLVGRWGIFRVMNATICVQGRQVSAAEVVQIRDLIGSHPDWSRYRLSRHLSAAWDWRNAVGQVKDMATRTLLLKLEQRGLVELPPCRMASPNRHRLAPAPERSWDAQTVAGSLPELGPLEVQEVSRQPVARREVRAALAQFHYLGYHTPVGETLQYALHDGGGRLLAALVFGAAAWQCAPRDEWIGWLPRQRKEHLGQLANNSRCLILPWVQVPALASWLLGAIARRIDADWRAKYGHGIRVLETFVERGRFAATCYRAANWIRVGVTTGRSRQDRTGTLRVPLKEVYLYALTPKFREDLCR
jgi:hypothetical protein